MVQGFDRRPYNLTVAMCDVNVTTDGQITGISLTHSASARRVKPKFHYADFPETSREVGVMECGLNAQ